MRARGYVLAAVAVAAGVSAVGQDAAATEHFRYERAVTVPGAGLACAVLHPAVYPHAEGTLGDLRVFAGGREVPYVVTQSGVAGAESDAATVRNLGRKGRAVVFDLEMPARPYTDVVLGMKGTGFLATATVRSGEGKDERELGRFPVFDLQAQRLARSTTLHLQETDAAVLHVELEPLAGSAPLGPEMVLGATVPPSREAQTLYTAAVSTGALVQRGRETVARMELPARVPIERVRVELARGFAGNFSREVRVVSQPAGQTASEGETLTGEIERMHLERGGAMLDEQRLTVPATLGANLQGRAEVEVAIENGDDAPLPVERVVLETRERRVCFVAPAGGGELRLFYGDAGLKPAVYDLERTFPGEQGAGVAVMGAEERNPAYRPRTDVRSVTERHPRMVYLLLAIAVSALGLVALRSAKLRV